MFALLDVIADDSHALTCSVQRGTSAPDPDPESDANIYAGEWRAIVTAAALLGVTLPPDVTCLGWHDPRPNIVAMLGEALT